MRTFKGGVVNRPYVTNEGYEREPVKKNVTYIPCDKKPKCDVCHIFQRRAESREEPGNPRANLQIRNINFPS